MNIVDSRLERADAEQRLASVAPERLTDDLAYWSVAAHDARDDQLRAVADLRAAAARFAEASEWVELVASELRRRRDARAGG